MNDILSSAYLSLPQVVGQQARSELAALLACLPLPLAALTLMCSCCCYNPSFEWSIKSLPLSVKDSYSEFLTVMPKTQQQCMADN